MRIFKAESLIAGLTLTLTTISAGHALTVGVTEGPHAQIISEVKKDLAAAGVELKVVEFNDWIMPNMALAQGDLDLNCFQTPQLLTEHMKTRGFKFVDIGKTISLPIGIYSTQYKDVNKLPIGAKIAIPNDAPTENRAFLLLEKAGLIQLKNRINPTILDVSVNQKKFKFIEMDSPQLPRVLVDVDAAIINTDWVLVSKLDPKLAIYREGIEAPYINRIVVRAGDEKKPEIQKFKAAYHSKHIRDYILRTFKGAVIPAW